MATIIPITPGETEQFIEIAPDGETYVLRVRFNTTDEGWYLDAWERDGTTPIAFGIKLVLGIQLGQTVLHPLFQGGLFLLDESGTGVDPGVDDLGGRVVLVHLTAVDNVLLSLGAPP